MRGSAPAAAVVVALALAGVVWTIARGGGPIEEPPGRSGADPSPVRERLFAELQPVALANCELQRFGEPHDGGYLMCANLLGDVEAGYSYGISGYDGWGCDVSTRVNVPVHQYDCFDTTEPACPSGRMTFHGECMAARTFADEEGRRFDTIENQFIRNGDGEARVVLKMDVEGAEWASFAEAPDEVLERIDQIAVEFHGIDSPRYLQVVQRLKQFFVVAHLHFNNYACAGGAPPFPADAYEVLFVHKRLAVVDPGRRVALPHPLDAPNNPDLPDCQVLVR